jgi:hypothetical protein
MAAPDKREHSMKVNIEIDMTPQEARAFLGLPDLEPMQQAILKDLQDRMQKNMARLDPEELVKSWFTLAPAGIDGLRKMAGGIAGAVMTPRGKKSG